MASLTSKRGIWYGVFTVGYKQKWVKIGCMSKAAAKEVLRKLEEAYDRKKFGIIDENSFPLNSIQENILSFLKQINRREAMREIEPVCTSSSGSLAPCICPAVLLYQSSNRILDLIGLLS